jgi:hypothetical protein
MLHVTTEEKIEDYKGVIRSRKGQKIQWSKDIAHRNKQRYLQSTVHLNIQQYKPH